MWSVSLELSVLISGQLLPGSVPPDINSGGLFGSAERSNFSEFIFNLRALCSNVWHHEETFEGSVLISSLIS